jgi:hypothetical protein
MLSSGIYSKLKVRVMGVSAIMRLAGPSNSSAFQAGLERQKSAENFLALILITKNAEAQIKIEFTSKKKLKLLKKQLNQRYLSN